MNRTKLCIADITNEHKSYKPSPLVEIGGKSVDPTLLDLGINNQDLDALYNSMLFNPSKSLLNGAGQYATTLFTDHADTTSYRFLNGTVRVIQNKAVSAISLNNIQSGQDIFDLYMVSSSNQSSNLSTTTVSPSTTTTTTPSAISTDDTAAARQTTFRATYGYFDPIVADERLLVAGYFSKNVPEIAILNIQSFETTNSSEFQSVVQTFLAKCKSAGKTRLIIDVRGNPGGKVFNGFDTFRQLFPSNDLIMKQRSRSHPAFLAISRAVSTLSPLTLDELNSIESEGDQSKGDVTALTHEVEGRTSEFSYKNNQKPAGLAFSSWADFAGPRKAHGDVFTNYFSPNLSNSVINEVFGGLDVSGTGAEANIAPQVFDKSNVVIVSTELPQIATFI
jgi:hypothetical protein